jgi:hypothetical protein
MLAGFPRLPAAPSSDERARRRAAGRFERGRIERAIVSETASKEPADGAPELPAIRRNEAGFSDSALAPRVGKAGS